MGRRPRGLTPEASARDRFGAELRRWRTKRGLTQRQLAALVWHSQELVSKVEKGQRWATRDLAARCDAALRTDGVLAGLWPEVEQQRLASDRRRRPRASPAGGHALILAACLLPGPVSWPLAWCALRRRGLHRATA
jgi:transcriptional regulator with XRE-family HTH domain